MRTIWTFIRHPLDSFFLWLCERRNVVPVNYDGYLGLAHHVDKSETRLRKSGSLNDGTGRRLAVRRKIAYDLKAAGEIMGAALWRPRWVA